MIETIELNPEKEKSDDLVPEDEIEINFVRSSINPPSISGF